MITFITVAILSLIACIGSYYGMFRFSMPGIISSQKDAEWHADKMQRRLDKQENDIECLRRREHALLVQLTDAHMRRAEEARERLDLLDERMQLELELQDLKNQIERGTP